MVYDAWILGDVPCLLCAIPLVSVEQAYNSFVFSY